MAVKMQNENGAVVVSTSVIAQIAGAVATRCYGVVGMSYKNTADGLVSLLRWDNLTKGIRIFTEAEKICIDLHIIVEYGINIGVICNSIMNNVRYSVESMTGFKVGKVCVNVEGIRVD